jgi:hypothetical protein
MKKFLILVSATMFTLAYEGCGINKKDALNTLSKSIYVSVNNQFSKDEELKKGLVNYFSSSVKNSTTQTSNVILKNVKFVTKNNQVCAEISKEDVKNSAKQALLELKNSNIDELPSDFEAKMKKINSLLGKIAFVKAVSNLNASDIKRLNKLEKQLKDLKNKGEVVFTLNIPYAEIKISGQDKTFSPSTPIFLPAGHYSYKIMADNYESATGEFDVKAGQKEIVSANLTSIKIMKKVKEKARYFTKSTEIDVDYGYAFNASNDKEWDSEKRIDVKLFKNLGIYKLGWGLSAGTKTRWTAKDMNEAEVLLAARIQFPELLDTQFHIGIVALIPYAGVEGGVDLYKFIDNNLQNGDDISSIVRGTLGTTILIHKQFGFNIQLKQGFMDKKDTIINAGLVMDF